MKASIISINLLLFTLIFSCKKDDQKVHEKCIANCAEINIQGRILEKPAEKGIANVPVSLKWVNYNNFISYDKLIAETKTDANGNFKFSVSIDTSYFYDSHDLRVIIPEKEDKIILSEVGREEYRFIIHEYPKTPLQSIEFKIYDRANLDIYLKRVLADSIDAMDIIIKYPDGPKTTVYINSKRITDTLARSGARTAANVFTRVIVRKKFNGIWNETIDSIKCASGVTNNIYLNY